MMRLVMIVSVALAALVSAAPARAETVCYMKVHSRIWKVVKHSEDPVVWKAVRDMNELNPYGPPAIPRTLQATRAIEACTSCKVIRSTMYQTITGSFYSQTACN